MEEPPGEPARPTARGPRAVSPVGAAAASRALSSSSTHSPRRPAILPPLRTLPPIYLPHARPVSPDTWTRRGGGGGGGGGRGLPGSGREGGAAPPGLSGAAPINGGGSPAAGFPRGSAPYSLRFAWDCAAAADVLRGAQAGVRSRGGRWGCFCITSFESSNRNRRIIEWPRLKRTSKIVWFQPPVGRVANHLSRLPRFLHQLWVVRLTAQSQKSHQNTSELFLMYTWWNEWPCASPGYGGEGVWAVGGEHLPHHLCFFPVFFRHCSLIRFVLEEQQYVYWSNIFIRIAQQRVVWSALCWDIAMIRTDQHLSWKRPQCVSKEGAEGRFWSLTTPADS